MDEVITLITLHPRNSEVKTGITITEKRPVIWSYVLHYPRLQAMKLSVIEVRVQTKLDPKSGAGIRGLLREIFAI
jgi:hypothetical protein